MENIKIMQPCESTRVREYHVRVDLLEHGGLQSLAMREISTIDGVDHVICSRYSVTVTKAQMFEWGEVQPKILEILEKATKAAPVREQLAEAVDTAERAMRSEGTG